MVVTFLHRGIMYNIKGKAICSLPHIGQFPDLHQTLWFGVGGYFCRFHLTILNVILMAISTNNKYVQ